MGFSKKEEETKSESFSGMKKVNLSAPFVNMTDVIGGTFRGIFLKRTECKSRLSKSGVTTAWLVKALEGSTMTADKDKVGIVPGKMYRLSEKASMMNMDIAQGEVFGIEYTGEFDSNRYKGKKFHAFDLYLEGGE